MADIYDDPELADPTDTGDFPPTLKFNNIGDRARGVVSAVGRFDGKGQKPALKYTLTDVKAKQNGVQSTHPSAEIIAGSKNLKGQMMTLKPRPGDSLDIELVEFRPSQYASPTKIYNIVVQRTDASAAMAVVNGDAEENDEEDLFA
jgi:hypothetical protein